MEKNQTVIGSYKTEDEAIRKIKDLLAEGYLKDEITIFTNPDVADKLSNPEHVDVAEPDLNGNDEDGKNKQSFWESVKDAFKVRGEDFYNEDNYTSDDDLLHDYRSDLDAGNIVVVVSNYHGEHSDKNDSANGRVDATPGAEVDNGNIDPQTGMMGTTPEVPDEGGVTGMGAGAEPKQDAAGSRPDGFQPELEDTDEQADSQELIEERQEKKDKTDD